MQLRPAEFKSAGAKADSQWGRRTWHFKMTATQLVLLAN